MAKKTNKMVKVSNNPVAKFLKITVATLVGSMAAYGVLILLDWVYQKIRPHVRTLYENLVNDWRGILIVAGFFALVCIIFVIDTAVRNRKAGSGRKKKEEAEEEEDSDDISSYSDYRHYSGK